DPDFDVLPLLDDHFVRRFADRGWRIFDVRRGYGIAYDGEQVRLIGSLGAVLEPLRAQRDEARLDGRETAFQEMWKAYFTAANIPARRDRRESVRQLPPRYWKYLSETQLQLPERPTDLTLRDR